MRGLFYSTRPLLGREGEGLIHHVHVIKTVTSEVWFLTEGVGTQIEDRLALSGIQATPVCFVSKFYKDTNLDAYDSWIDIYESLDVSPLGDFDCLYLIGGLDLWRSNLTRFGKRVGVFPLDRGQIKFQSAGLRLINILAMLKAHHQYEIPIHEVSFDPNEMSMDLFHPEVAPSENYTLYHGYDIPRYNMVRLDSSQYAFSLNRVLFEEEKTMDFVFGYSALKGSNRENYGEYIHDLANSFGNGKLYAKTEKVDNSIPRSLYIHEVSRSKYTLILPAYDETCFSVYRFIESLVHNCLPIIHPSCRIDEIEQSFGVDLTPLIDRVPSEEERIQILNRINKSMTTFDRGFMRTNHD